MMMKAAHTSDSFRASGNADNLPCNAKDLPFDLPHCCRDKTSSLQRGTAILSACDKAPNSHVHQEEQQQQQAAHHQVLNAMQTGCPRTRRPPTSSMERSTTCSCTAPRSRPDMEKLGYYKLHCNCNMENCGFFQGDHIESHSTAPQCGRGASCLVGKSHSWRSSPSPARSFNDSSRSTNAALQRALAAMKKVSGEPDAVKKQQTPLHKGPDTVNEAHLAAYEGINGRCITSSDARTMSMRERGRWGNSKMQQQCSSIGSYHSNQSFIAPNLSGRLDSRGISDHHRQQLHHVQCLHCGSFSTTPVSGAAHSATSKGGRSHFFRRVRDYSWQQELQEQKKPEQQLKDLPLPPAGRGQDPQPHCEYARCPDFHAEHDIPAPGVLPRHAAADPVHHHSSLSWQDRYMLLCQAIAAGAFLDGGMEEENAASRGYSWAACDCSSCEISCGGSLRRPASHDFSTTTSERMMELEAFSGPLGYVSESKGMGLIAEEAKRTPSSSSTRRGGRGRWWARLPNFGKGKSERQPATPAQEGGRAGQATAQCTSCGQRVWVREREEEEEEGRLCPECLGRAGSEPLPVPQSGRPNFTSAAAHNSHRPHINFAYKAAAGSYKHYPRRWRLMKLCRYLLGFPMQR